MDEIELTRTWVVASDRESCLARCRMADIDPTYATTILVDPTTDLHGHQARPGDQIIYGFLNSHVDTAAMFDRLRAIGFVFS